MKKIIVLLSISLLLSTSLYSKNKKNVSSIGKIVKMVAGIGISIYLWEKYDIKEIAEFPIVKEALKALKTEEEYQVRWCENPKGEKVAIPSSFDVCPYKNSIIHDGPLLSSK